MPDAGRNTAYACCTDCGRTYTFASTKHSIIVGTTGQFQVCDGRSFYARIFIAEKRSVGWFDPSNGQICDPTQSLLRRCLLVYRWSKAIWLFESLCLGISLALVCIRSVALDTAA